MPETKPVKVVPQEDIPSTPDGFFVRVRTAGMHVERKLDLVAHLSWFILLRHAHLTLTKNPDCQMFTIPLSQFREEINYKSKNYEYLYAQLDKLMTTVLKWNIFEKDSDFSRGKKKGWAKAPLLSEVRVIDSDPYMLSYSFPPSIQATLMNPESFVRLNLVIAREFKHKHSFDIYCLALSYWYIKSNYGEKKFSVENLREYLGLTDKYTRMKHFMSDVIRVAVEEINASTDMELNIEPIKAARGKIVGFQFKMKIKEENLTFYLSPKEASKVKQLNMPQQVAKVESSFPIESRVLNAFFQQHTISLKGVKYLNKLELLKDKIPEGDIEAYLEYLVSQIEFRIQAGNKIKNVGGLFGDMVMKDRQLDNYIISYAEEENRQVELKSIQLKQQQEHLEKELKRLHSEENMTRFEQHIEIQYDDLKGTIKELLFDKPPLRKKVDSKSELLKRPTLSVLLQYAEQLNFNRISYEEWMKELSPEDFAEIEAQTALKK